MPDIASTDTAPTAPPPPSGAGYNPGVGDADANAAFQQALQDAGPPDDSDDADASASGAEGASDGEAAVDTDDTSGEGQSTSASRKRGSCDGAAGGLGGALAALVGAPPRHAQALRGRGGTEGRQDTLGAVEGRTAEGPQALQARAGGVDLDVFADLLDRAAAQAPLAASQTFQLALGDPRAPVNSISMTRLPDGTLSMTLGTDTEAVTQVRAALESLRRRLEAKGVPIAALTAEGANAGVEGQDAA